MKMWFRGKKGGFVAFLAISTLVVSGLGWVTWAALRLEHEQFESQAQARLNDKLRLAMWRLDSRISPLLAREDSRPYSHFNSIFAPPLAMNKSGSVWQPGTVLEPSPLLNEELPDWMLLHFQTDGHSNWESPQVLTPDLSEQFRRLDLPPTLVNVSKDREQLLGRLRDQADPRSLLASIRERGEQLRLVETTLALTNSDLRNMIANAPPQTANSDSEYLNRAMQQAQLRNPSNMRAQIPAPGGDDKTARPQKQDGSSRAPPKTIQTSPVSVVQSSMVPLWFEDKYHQDLLLFARFVQVGDQDFCQGILLDWPKLQTLLSAEVNDLFAEVRFEPLKTDEPPHPERTMTTLPVELKAGLTWTDLAVPRWTPLRVGLVLSWVAASLALLAVGLGGWALIELSERRVRFVSAVTHELRTPLTTLRLYLDMLSGGMVKEERQKEEYLQTLNTEADRLNRLVGNVLDFSRLERQRPRLAKSQLRLGDFLDQVVTTWQGRCRSADKELVLENSAGEDLTLFTDVQITQQILGNLIDNACKYSQGAGDRRIWLRASIGSRRAVVFEVEDRGPGVPQRERRSIFRPFSRGKSHDVVAGGVGLGLALAQRWAHFLGGELTLGSGHGNSGACFRLTVPVLASG
jgi:signal transduction histidine kinase